MTDLDTLRPEVRETIAYEERAVEPGDTLMAVRVTNWELLRAELRRLAEEKHGLREYVHAYGVAIKRAERAEAELAALKARIAEAEVAELPRDFDTTHPMSAGIYITGGTASALIGKRVRLLVEE